MVTAAQMSPRQPYNSFWIIGPIQFTMAHSIVVQKTRREWPRLALTRVFQMSQLTMVLSDVALRLPVSPHTPADLKPVLDYRSVQQRTRRPLPTRRKDRRYCHLSELSP